MVIWINMEELTKSEQERFDKLWNSLSSARKATIAMDFDHFCSWLRGEDSIFYNAIKYKLHKVWEEIKSMIGGIADAGGRLCAAVTFTPIIGVYEGVKEGIENGFEAGVKKSLKSMGRFLDNIFD